MWDTAGPLQGRYLCPQCFPHLHSTKVESEAQTTCRVFTGRDQVHHLLQRPQRFHSFHPWQIKCVQRHPEILREKKIQNHSSYFQVKVHRKFWQYLGVMTPYRGLRVITRLGQGLLNSDVHLEQVVTRVLGDEMLRGMCVIARDDLNCGR